jgi:hypothetical protein
MEQVMFPRKEVVAQLKNYVVVELFMDGETAEDKANRDLELKLINTIAMPAYVIVTPEGKPLRNMPQMTRDTDAFVAFLRDGLAAYKQEKIGAVARILSERRLGPWGNIKE